MAPAGIKPDPGPEANVRVELIAHGMQARVPNQIGISSLATSGDRTRNAAPQAFQAVVLLILLMILLWTWWSTTVYDVNVYTHSYLSNLNTRLDGKE